MMAERLNRAALMAAAEAVRANAYAPYSRFGVGAALLAADGRIFTGCNVENAAYGESICAERVALLKAVSEGCRDFAAIAVAGGPLEDNLGDAPAPSGNWYADRPDPSLELGTISAPGGNRDDVSHGDSHELGDSRGCWPCGACRQVLFEFGGEALAVVVRESGALREVPLGELLPHAFGPAHLEG